MFTEAFWFDTSGVGEAFCIWSGVLISRHGEVFLLSRGKSSLVSRIRSIWTGDRCREPRSGWGERDTLNEPFSGPLSASLSPSFGMAEARSARRSSDNRLFWRLNILFFCIVILWQIFYCWWRNCWALETSQYSTDSTTQMHIWLKRRTKIAFSGSTKITFTSL